MGKFEVKQGEGGKYYFNLKADNGQVILSSQGYASKNGCLNGVESVRNNGSVASFEKKTAANGKFYFNLKASNAQVIGKSQQYADEKSRDKGIDSVIRNAAGASVQEV